MRINKWLWGLWVAMILSILMRQRADIYIVVALIVLPILIVLLDLHEEIAVLKDENKHQRKFVMERYNILQERLNDMSNHIEKRLVVDFAEFAKNNPSNNNNSSQPAYNSPDHNPVRKLKKRRRPEELAPIPIDFEAPVNDSGNTDKPELKPEA